jgi:hypothetical protein
MYVQCNSEASLDVVILICAFSSHCPNFSRPHIQNLFMCTVCLRETLVSPISGNVSVMLINVRASSVKTVH